MRLRKKVVHLVEDMRVGGLERNLALIVEHLDRTLFDVSVWCLEEGGAIADELADKGVDLQILDLCTYHRPGNILKLARLLKSHRVDILHTHEYFANTMGRLSGILARTPKRFAHIQNSHWTPAERTKRHYLIDRFLSFFCDRVIACSDAARRYQIEVEKIHPDKVVTIYNCTDLSIFNGCDSCRGGARRELGLSDGHILIGSVARLTRVKGHRFFIEAMKKIASEFPQARALLVGDGQERANLEQQVRLLGLEKHVVFLGTRHDVPDVLRAIDVFVLPTVTREGLPLSIAEAMACEKPVVATDVGGVPEAIVPGATGVLVPPGHPDALAEGILYLLRNPELAKKMGRAGHELCVSKFSVQACVRQIEALYQECG